MGRIQLRFQKWDIAVIAAVLLTAVLVFALFLPQREAPAEYAEIYLEGKLIKVISLEEDQEFTIVGAYTNTITVRDGKIAVTASDCPGGDCLQCGWIESAAVSIVCLPNKLEIRAVTGSGDVDFVVG